MGRAVISTFRARGIRRRRPRGEFATRLWQLISREYGGSQRKFALACGLGPRRVTDWLYESRVPEGENLRKIGKQTGYSVDWLLGFEDVPRARTRRAEIGVLAEAVNERLDLALRSPYREHEYQTNRPPHPTSDANAFMKALQQAWTSYWSALEKEFWARALEQLADSLNSAKPPDDDDEVQAMLIEHAIRAKEFAALVRTFGRFAERMSHSQDLVAREYQRRAYPEVAESRLRRLASGKPASPKERSIPYLVFPDAAAGGVGFAWRGKEHDHAWWIDGETGRAKSRRRSRFLIVGGHGDPPANAYEIL